MISMLRANFCRIGISPSIFVLWFNTSLPKFKFIFIIFTKYYFWEINFSSEMIINFEVLLYLCKWFKSNDFSDWVGCLSSNFYFFNCNGCLGKKWRRLYWYMILFLTYEINLSQFLIFTSFVLLIFITFAVIYISYVSWKDKKRLKK